MNSKEGEKLNIKSNSSEDRINRCERHALVCTLMWMIWKFPLKMQNCNSIIETVLCDSFLAAAVAADCGVMLGALV